MGSSPRRNQGTSAGGGIGMFQVPGKDKRPESWGGATPKPAWLAGAKWTPEQTKAGGRWERPPPVPGQASGIANNWVASSAPAARPQGNFWPLTGQELLTAKMFGRYPEGYDVKAAQRDNLARAFAGGFGHRGGYGRGGDH